MEPTLEVRAEDKLVYTLPYEEEEDRVCEVKCPKAEGTFIDTSCYNYIAVR